MKFILLCTHNAYFITSTTIPWKITCNITDSCSLYSCQCTRVQTDSHLDRSDGPYPGSCSGRTSVSILSGWQTTERTRPEKPFRLLTRMGSLSGFGWRRLFRTGCSHYEQRWQSQHDPALCIFGTESSGRWNRNHHPDERWPISGGRHTALCSLS